MGYEPHLGHPFEFISSQFSFCFRIYPYDSQNLVHLMNELLKIFINLGTMEFFRVQEGVCIGRFG